MFVKDQAPKILGNVVELHRHVQQEQALLEQVIDVDVPVVADVHITSAHVSRYRHAYVAVHGI
jgi:hypothetical protein